MRTTVLNIFAACALLFVPVGAFAASAEAPQVNLQIVANEGQRGIDLTDPLGHFQVVLSNFSGHPIKISAEDTSWGYSNLSFEATDVYGNTRKIFKPPTKWDSNFPRPILIENGAHYVFHVNFDPAIWKNSPLTGPTGREVLRLKAIYDSQLPADDYWTREGGNKGVWAGKVSSSEYAYTLTWLSKQTSKAD